MSLTLKTEYLKKFINEDEYLQIEPFVKAAHKLLHEKTGAGNEFTGWLNLPTDYNKQEFERIKEAAKKIRSDSDILILIGIGGSYLGARAAIEFLKSSNYNLLEKNSPKIFFVGNSISPSYLNEILEISKGKRISINVISKSGTTTEPAIAFRIFKEFLEKQVGKEEAKKRIYCTTDEKKGTLLELSKKEGYQTFVIPNNIGGRYSVLTAVGLLPIAVCGADIDKLIKGAQAAKDNFKNENLTQNDCYKYAAIRNILYRKGKDIEILESYEPRFSMLKEWFKQLFGESEGKDQKGILPTSLIFSTDLHSMGQYIQSGKRNIFETVLLTKEPINDIKIKNDPNNFDGLNFLVNKNMSEINNKAALGTILAHYDGDVPNIILNIDRVDEENLGYLIYFFEKACAISGYLMGVNPFNQPGVEDYKKNMFALLNKPGYEEENKKINQRLLSLN